MVSGLSFRANAFKECEEEASIPRSLLETRLKSAGKTLHTHTWSSNIQTSTNIQTSSSIQALTFGLQALPSLHSADFKFFPWTLFLCPWQA
jgi:hypothetical protein